MITRSGKELALSLFAFLLFGGAHQAQAGKKASVYRFDDFSLGDNYATKVLSRAPYDQPCDNDPIDHRNRRFMVYGALPCRDRTFPHQTTVMFYLKYAEEDRYSQPIEAFAYLHGSYFNDKTEFPLKPGESLKKAASVLGAELGSFEIRRKKFALTVHRFRGNIHVLCSGETIVGFVFGAMPSDPENEQWRGLMQMYQRYTPK